jgi:hypothetical protein
LRELGAKLTEGDYQSALLSKKAFFKKFLKEYVLIEGTVMVVQGSDNDVRYRDELLGLVDTEIGKTLTCLLTNDSNEKKLASNGKDSASRTPRSQSWE